MEDLARRRPEFGEVVPRSFDDPEFSFAIPADGSLPLAGVLPSMIDHRGRPTAMSDFPGLGVRLMQFSLAHPDPVGIEAHYNGLEIDRPPEIRAGPFPRYEATIETPDGRRIPW